MLAIGAALLSPWVGLGAALAFLCGALFIRRGFLRSKGAAPVSTGRQAVPIVFAVLVVLAVRASIWIGLGTLVLGLAAIRLMELKHRRRVSR